jgi:diguanylate cyclase (GGDEF)-like protein/PAS domain S-box-containing protein
MDGYISRALLQAADAQKRSLSATTPGVNPIQSLERLFDGVPYPVLVKDRSHRWVLMNDAWCALMRRPREELLGHTDHDLVPADQADGYIALDDEVFATGGERQIEESLTLADGTVHILQTRKRLVRLAGPCEDEVFVIVSCADITRAKKTEAALRESEERYRATVELSPLIAWTADPHGVILDVAERWYQQTGLTPEQSLGTAWTAALHPEDLPETIRRWGLSLRTGAPFSMEYRYRLRDGSYGWVHARATAHRDDAGRTTRWYGTLEDIQDRKLAEIALRESEEHYRYTIELSPQLPWLANADGKLTAVSPRWTEMTGMAAAEALDVGWAAAVHPDDMQATQVLLAHSLQTGEPLEAEFRLRASDGSYRWTLTRSSARLDEQGKILRWYGTTEDIHDRKLAEQALRESEMRFRAMADDAPVMIWVSDEAGACIFSNRLWYETTGQTESEVQGLGWIEAIHPDDQDAVEQAFSIANRQHECFRTEYRLRRAKGGYAWVIDTANPRFAPDGTFLGYIGSVIDISERRAMELALRESEDHYRHTVELNPQFPFTADPDGMLLEISPRFRERFGLSHEASLGTGWMRLIHPDDLSDTQRNWMTAMATGTRVDHEKRLRLPDGSYRWFRGRASARRDAEGRVVRWYGSTEDIHDRKAAEEALRASEAFAHSVLGSSPNCIRVLDLEGRLLFMNEAGYRLLETESDAVAGQGWAPTLPAEYADEAQRAFASAQAGHSSRHHAHRVTRSGAVQWLDITLTPVPGANGRPAQILSIWHDVTEVRQARETAEQARREAEAAAAHLSSVLESTMDSVIVLDCDWRLTYLNTNAKQALRDRSPRLGLSLWTIFPDEAEGVFARNYQRAMDQQVPVAFEEYLHALGCWLEVHAYPSAEGISIFFRDVTERRKAEQERLIAQEKIAHMARHDALTGLPNRVFFREQLERALIDSRHGARAAVLYLDLDGFKAVNDTLGHPAGDALLRQVGERLQQCVRGSDMVARFGGDEFAIIQTSIRSNEDADELARRIVVVLSEPFELDGQQVAIGTSIGVAFVPEDGGSPDELLKAADMALYRAKGDGRGVHRFFEPGMDESLRARQVIKLALREALARGEFELHYQPLIDLSTSEISCFEALLRWRHPDGRMISPADFIPVAEETGLIIQIGEWALREACRQAMTWPCGVSVAVNLSPVQFRSRGLVDTVRAALTAAGLQPGRLQLEITESVLLQDDNGNLAMLQELRRLGVRIAMDDFGTGYSSLGYLRSFPFDKIKLDRSFVNDLPSGIEAQAIVRAVAGLCAGLCITTTAEGIETVHQLAALRKDGYNEGQGFLFSRPVPAAEALRLVQRASSSLAREEVRLVNS